MQKLQMLIKHITQKKPDFIIEIYFDSLNDVSDDFEFFTFLGVLEGCLDKKISIVSKAFKKVEEINQ